MVENLGKLAQDIENLVDGFLSRAQMPAPMAAIPMGGPDSVETDSLKDDLIEKFKQPIVNDAQDILYNLVVKLDNARVKECDRKQVPKCVFEAWGAYHIDVKLAIRRGVASIGFAVNANAAKNKARNQQLAQLLNRKRANYNKAINQYLAKLSDHKSINTDMNPNFFEIQGFMEASPPSVAE